MVNEPLAIIKQREQSYFERVVLEAGLVPNVAYTTPNMETLRTHVGRGDAWSILISGRPIAGQSPEGRPLASVRIADDVAPIHIAIATSSDHQQTKRAKRVADLCHTIVATSVLGRTTNSLSTSQT